MQYTTYELLLWKFMKKFAPDGSPFQNWKMHVASQIKTMGGLHDDDFGRHLDSQIAYVPTVSKLDHIEDRFGIPIVIVKIAKEEFQYVFSPKGTKNRKVIIETDPNEFAVEGRPGWYYAIGVARLVYGHRTKSINLSP